MVISFTNIATVTWGPINEELGFGYSILNNSFAAGCGAFAIGGIFLIHFALKYGRRPVYIFSTAIQCGLSIWSAKMQTIADLMLVNILNSFVGALSEIIVQMTVADIYFVHQRGLANSIYIWCMTIGVSLAPLAAGYVTNSQGWRWVWWWMAILFGIGVVVFFFLYEETMYTVIEGVTPSSPSRPDEDTCVKPSTDPQSQHQYQEPIPKHDKPLLTTVQVDTSIPEKPYWKKLALWTSSPASFTYLVCHIYQPFLIMVHIPAVFFMSLMYGAMTAAVTVPTATFSTYLTMPPYNFTSVQIGLMGLPSFIGITLSVLISGPLSDWLILRMAKRNNGIYEPETRLWMILLFAPFVPAGLLLFGIGLNNHLPWPVIALGLGLTTFGTTTGNSIPLTYLTDAYTDVSEPGTVVWKYVNSAELMG
ncbi:hypothetical protein EYZ11_005967 [Aspergillus tanneri]|nr:hypothetical protein EYZ11_005967 [Aspergillus tanneri]